jgi:cyclic 2,3-diphosphoglycerate synthetase
LELEGSGAAQPPSHFDAAALVVHAATDPTHLVGYFGLHRVLLSDLVLFTMCEVDVGESQLRALEQAVRSRPREAPRIVRAVLRPRPLADVAGKRIWFATTSSPLAAGVLGRYLEDELGARVVGMSHALANRAALRSDLAELPDVDAVCVELKAAAVDLVTREALRRGIEVIYVDNQPVPVDGDPGRLREALLELAELARQRFTGRA